MASSSAASEGVARRPTHAGSWYSDSARELGRQLDGWLGQVHASHGPARAIIAPHAGYSYCGATAAHAYKQVDPTRLRRIFVLGPSHHVCLSGCALSACSTYRTPLGDLRVDQAVNGELLESGAFETMDVKMDESEHSIEMQLPFIARVMAKRRPDSYAIVPVLVGSLSAAKHASYGRVFAPYIADPDNLFVVSSDFCHWGSRFQFSPFERHSSGEIHEQVEALDREAMRVIETLQPAAFADYLKRTQNTICGRHPISVMLQAAEHFRQMNNHQASMRFVDYSQSNRCRSAADSSVSYAAGSLVINPK